MEVLMAVRQRGVRVHRARAGIGLLERLYKTGSFQLPVIYGHRRVGKTVLIERFVRDLPCVCFTAVESDASTNLRKELYAFDHPGRNSEAASAFFRNCII